VDGWIGTGVGKHGKIGVGLGRGMGYGWMPCLGCPPLDAQIALAVAFALSFSIFSSFSIQIDSDIT
jgi:hypothetical protein